MRNESLAVWEQSNGGNSDKISAEDQTSVLQNLLTSVGAYFWGASDVAVSEKKEVAAIPENGIGLIECQYCKSMVKVINDNDLCEHEDECIEKLDKEKVSEI